MLRGELHGSAPSRGRAMRCNCRERGDHREAGEHDREGVRGIRLPVRLGGLGEAMMVD